MDADAAWQGKPPPKIRRPRGPALSGTRITQAALALIDEAGLDAFSVRSLAAKLGCQAMSIYHYFPSRTHLFEALVEILLAEAMQFPRTGPWAEQLRAAASAYRQMALNHRGFFLYFATFRLNNRAGLTYLECLVRILEASGLEEATRACHFRTLQRFLVGSCLEEISSLARGALAGPSAAEPVPFEIARRDFPALMAVGPYFAPDRQSACFTAGIDLLIRAIEADLAR